MLAQQGRQLLRVSEVIGTRRTQPALGCQGNLRLQRDIIVGMDPRADLHGYDLLVMPMGKVAASFWGLG